MKMDWMGWIKLLSPQQEPCMICSKPLLPYTPCSHTRSWITNLKLEQMICKHCIGEIAWIDKVLCPYCGRSERCLDCSRRVSPSLWLNRSAVRYTEQMKQWLHCYKFQGDERLAGLLGRMLLPAVEQLSRQIIIKNGLEAEWILSSKLPTEWLKRTQYSWDAITAVPLSEQRHRERGFNQAQQLASIISEHYAIPYYPLLYRKGHHVVRSSHQGRQARIAESKEKYSGFVAGWNRWLKEQRHSLQKKELLHILLVDDVYTTGSTVHACAEALIEISPVSLAIASVTWARS